MDNKQQTINNSTTPVTNQPVPPQPIPTVNPQPAINPQPIATPQPIGSNPQPISSNPQPTIVNHTTSSNAGTPIRYGANALLLITGILLIAAGVIVGFISLAFSADSGKIRGDGILFSLLVGGIPAGLGIALIILGRKIRTKNRGAKLLGKILLAIIGLLLIINGIIGISNRRISCEHARSMANSTIFTSPRFIEENNREINIYCNSAPTHSIFVITIGSTLIGLAILLHLIKSKK